MCLQTLQAELKEAEADFEKVRKFIAENTKSLTRSKSKALWDRHLECLTMIEQLHRDIRLLRDT